MGDRRASLASLTKEQEAALLNLRAQLATWQTKQAGPVPLHIQILGHILRRSAATGKLGAFRRFLRRHKIECANELVSLFRDSLIVQRADLRDLQAAARMRLRLASLRDQEDVQMTADYRQAKTDREAVHCRDCHFLRHAPMDDGPESQKTCADLGAQGSDVACYGFVQLH